MRKVYQLLMLMVLACIGINTSQAQKRYEVSDLSTPLSIDDFVGEKFVIHNGSLGDSEKDFVKGLEKSVSVTDENLFTVHHRAPPLSKTGNNISISTLQILLKVVTFAQASK